MKYFKNIEEWNLYINSLSEIERIKAYDEQVLINMDD